MDSEIFFDLVCVVMVAVHTANGGKNYKGKTQCKDNQMIDVAVVGAGIAGVYTAWKLAENYPDWTIHIYEANNRVGGRTYSIPLPKVTDFKADVGAMRFKKSLEPRLYRLGKELGLTIQPFNTPRDENTLHYLRSKLLTPRDLAKGNVPYEMTDDERIHAADESLYGYWTNMIIANESKEIEDPWQRFCTDGKMAYEKGITNAFLEVGSVDALQYMTDKNGFHSVTGNNWNYAEWSDLVSHWGDPEDYDTFREGFQQLPLEMMDQILQKPKKKLFKNHELTSVSHNGKSGRLQFLDKKSDKTVNVCARKVILGVPADSLKRITFKDRDLSRKLGALLPSVDQGPACKIFLVYNSPWWRSKGRGEAFQYMRSIGKDVERIITNLPLGIIIDLGTDSKTGKAVLILYNDWWSNTHFWSPYMTKGVPDKSAVKAEFVASEKLVRHIGLQFSKVFNLPEEEIPKPETTVPHCWFTAPYWTAWHNKAAGFNFPEVIDKILKPVTRKDVYIVGEAFSNHQTEVEGALETAQNLLTKHFNISL